MWLYKLRKDILINLESINIVIDQGYTKTGHKVRIHTIDGQHEYNLNNEDYSRFMMKLKELEERE